MVIPSKLLILFFPVEKARNVTDAIVRVAKRIGKGIETANGTEIARGGAIEIGIAIVNEHGNEKSAIVKEIEIAGIIAVVIESAIMIDDEVAVVRGDGLLFEGILFL